MEVLQRLEATPGRRPVLTTPDYWVRHLRQTVRFGDGLDAVLKDPGAVLVEVGPGQALSALARMARGGHRPAAIVASCRKPDEADSDLAFALGAAARLWTSGHDLDWERVRGPGSVRRISLPTYAFERQRHWIEPGVPAAAASPATSAAISRLANLDDWFHVPEWRPTPLAPASREGKRHCLVFSGEARVPALRERTCPGGEEGSGRLADRGLAGIQG